MSEKKSYPLRISTEVLQAVQRWSDEELRSLNAQIEYLLRDALRRSGRLKQTVVRRPRNGALEQNDGE